MSCVVTCLCAGPYHTSRSREVAELGASFREEIGKTDARQKTNLPAWVFGLEPCAAIYIHIYYVYRNYIHIYKYIYIYIYIYI